MSEESEQQRLREQLAHIGARYLTRTLGELRQIDELAAKADAGCAEALKELKRMAHKIHGSAAMFGFGEVSTHAREVEQIAAELGGKISEGSQDIDEAALRQRLKRSVGELGQVTRAAAKASGIEPHG
jgi:HPt (histidine-containing phosphotransfer) domain-containing protein